MRSRCDDGPGAPERACELRCRSQDQNKIPRMSTPAFDKGDDRWRAHGVELPPQTHKTFPDLMDVETVAIEAWPCLLKKNIESKS